MVVVLRGSLDLYRAKGEISLDPRRGRRHRAARAPGRAAGPAAPHARGRGPAAAQRRAAAARGPAARRAGRQPGHRGLSGLPRPADRLGVRVPCLARAGHACRAPARRPPSPGRVTALSRSDCDVIAVVRGGGARADLAAFETEVVARAVADARPSRSSPASATPATRRWPTSWRRAPASRRPSAGSRSCVTTRHWWAAHVAEPAALLARRVPTFLGDAQSRDSAGARAPDRGGAATAPRAPGAPGRRRRRRSGGRRRTG